MSTTRKIVIGLGIASGALLTAWLLTGNRKEKTKKLITKGASSIKGTMKKSEPKQFDDSEAHYV